VIDAFSGLSIRRLECRYMGPAAIFDLRPRNTLSEHGGWERIAADGSWIRWNDGDVFAGRPEEMNPTIDGPAQDKLVKRRVFTGEALLRLVK
jgi:hypothetical protein